MMPLARYFMYVGGVLLALLLISNAYLPKLPDAVTANTDLPVIRIHSDRKWPERVVFDTNRPVVAPVQVATTVAPVQLATTQASAAAAAAAEDSAEMRVREAFAQLPPSDVKQLQSSEVKKPEPKRPLKRKVAKRRAAPPVMLVAQQPQFGFFTNNTW
jgi:hypothetical protein